MSSNRRVVITGAGVVSALGVGVEVFWNSCLAGRTVVASIPEKWNGYSEFRSTIYSPLELPVYSQHGIHRVEELQLDPVALNAIVAAQEALQSARIKPEIVDEKSNSFKLPEMNSERGGVFVGTGVGGISSMLGCHAHQMLARQKSKLGELRAAAGPAAEALIAELDEALRMPRRFNPYVVSMIMPNASAAVLSIKFSLHGPSVTSSAACASGTIAIGQATEAIQHGKLDFALAGGSEFIRDDAGANFRGFDIVGALAGNCEQPEDANRPFDERRSGFLFSEGATAMFMLESLDHAVDRGAPIVAEVVGFAESNDAHSVMMIDKSHRQIDRMLRQALQSANLAADDIDYVNTHGTSTQLNDDIEAEVIDGLFGKKPAVAATKSLVGHTLGASGALETLVTALTLSRQESHACRNLQHPIRDLNFVTRSGPLAAEAGITQSFAFGGHNSALVLRRFH